MMKKISTIFITLILLFSIGVSTAYAEYSHSEVDAFSIYGEETTTTVRATSSKSTKKKVKKPATNTTTTAGTFYRYRWDPTLSKMKNAGLITYDWFVGTEGSYKPEKNGHRLCANSPDLYGDETNTNACRHNIRFWNLYYVKVGSKYFISYCINPARSIKNKGGVTQDTTLANMSFSDSHLTTEQKKERIELLEKLLLYGHNVSPDNNITAGTAVNRDSHNYLKMIAMQVLVYEITEGGRNSFDTIKPNVWGGRVAGEEGYEAEEDYSMYHQIIEPNGADNPDKKDTLYAYYKEAIENARDADQRIPSTAFNERNYSMSWDSLNKKYTVTVKGLGSYDEECESDNPKVNVVLNDDDSVTLSSTETIKDAKITCSFGRGNGSVENNDMFRYFRFTTKGLQDMLYGSGYKVYSDWFNVSSENSSLLIKKVDVDNKSVSGAKFTLTHMTNLDYSVNVDGNGSAQNLILSGRYRVSETTIPDGFDKINDFNITVNAKTHKITNCDGQKTDDAGTVVSCMNNQVKVAYANNGTIELTIIDMPKNIKILKVNKDGSPINGAAFEIRDKNNTLLKFSIGAGNVYKFDAAGTVTTISNPSVNPYTIALLPEGEYKIIETAAPANYRLPIDEASRTTLIKINANRELSIYDNNRKTYVPAGTATVRVINYNTNIKVHKTGNGKPLEGVQFELYNSDRSVKIKSTMGFPGRYTYADDQTTAGNTVYVTNASGDITIDNVPEGTYYLKEIATIEPYVLPDGVYTKVDIKVDEKGVSVNGNYTLSTIEISNTPNSFNFYKRDPEGNSLSGGKYKLQKYNKKTKKYEDVKLSEVQNDGTYADNADVFKEDSTNGEIQFTLTKGVATFIDMESATTYRIIEIEAPEGYDKVSADDTAIVTIDEHGNASGLLVLVDPPLPDEDASAFAELIINIQTGKQRILYAAVIFVVVGAIAGLIIYNNKKKK